MNDNGQQHYKESEKVIPLEAVEKPTLDPSAHQALKNDSSRKEVMKELFEKSRQGLMKVNLAWMDKLYAEPSLRERMTFFWHNHFACRTLVPLFTQTLVQRLFVVCQKILQESKSSVRLRH